MAQKAPGKAFRKGISLIELMRRFPDDATAEAWFAETRWPNGPACPHCGSVHVLSGAKHATMPYRCREKGCRKRFSVKTGTVMEASNIGYQKWAIAIYLALTSLKSISSMKMHRDLETSQKSAWHMAHRLRRAFAEGGGVFSGPVEVDESYFGGKRANMSNAKRKQLADEGAGRGAVGKVAVVGIKDRATNQVRAKVTERVDAPSLQGFVVEHTAPDATVYSDDAGAYETLPRTHETVRHSVSEYVRDMRTPMGSNHSGRPSSAPTKACSTRSARSILTATCRSLQASTITAATTPPTRCAAWSNAWTTSGFATANSSPTTGWTPGREARDRQLA